MRVMVRLLPILGFIVAFGCRTAPPPAPPAPVVEETVTRQSEPLLPTPRARPSATRFEPTKIERLAVEDALMREATRNELLELTALELEDGAAAYIALHTRYSEEEEVEEKAAVAANSGELERCDERFPECATAPHSCETPEYESCVRAAYPDLVSYFAAHHGLQCGTVEISRFERSEGSLQLTERVVVEELACDVLVREDAFPAAADIDGDGGPELVYVLGFSGRKVPEELVTEALFIVDADDLHLQTRLQSTPPDVLAEEEAATMTSIALDDRNDDGLADLVVQTIRTRNYCGETAWSLPENFVSYPSDGARYACQIEVSERVLPYDALEDGWRAVEAAGP